MAKWNKYSLFPYEAIILLHWTKCTWTRNNSSSLFYMYILIDSHLWRVLYKVFFFSRIYYKHGCHSRFLILLIGWFLKSLLSWNHKAKWNQTWNEAFLTVLCKVSFYSTDRSLNVAAMVFLDCKPMSFNFYYGFYYLHWLSYEFMQNKTFPSVYTGQIFAVFNLKFSIFCFRTVGFVVNCHSYNFH